jgi:hypothetical protein
MGLSSGVSAPDAGHQRGGNRGTSPITPNKRLDRFTLRGRQKVDTQWKLYCMVHNIEKLAHHGYGQ